MGTILMIMSVPFLYATGIYNPPVVQHGRCIAEPGTFNALFCMGRAELRLNGNITRVSIAKTSKGEPAGLTDRNVLANEPDDFCRRDSRR